MGAKILLEPAQLGDKAGGRSCEAAGMRWRLLAGLEEGVCGLSGLGGRTDSADRTETGWPTHHQSRYGHKGMHNMI